MPAPFAQLSTWQETAKQMRFHRDSTILAINPKLPDFKKELPRNVTGIPKAVLTERELEITEATPEHLLNAMAKGLISSAEVTGAFLRRAGLAGKLVNCITELLPDRALHRAAELDAYYSEHAKPIGPLHGLPISVKEHISMKDLDCNAGFVSWVGRTASNDALILRLLWDAGAVFYARTTQPQTLMHLETSSNLYGVTVNPFNTALTSGGSSGGEGALIGMRGSCLGIGTDIGGSIRSPAANNGVYGLRPTTYRLPTEGLAATTLNQEHIVPVLIEAEPWLFQPSLLPIPWRMEDDLLKKSADGEITVKVAILWDDGVVKPHPPVTRALKELSEKLKQIPGIQIVDWEPYKHDLAWEIIASLYFCDGGSEEIDAIVASGEPWRPLSEFILKDNPHVRPLSVAEMWDWTGKREEYRKNYAEVWNSTATTTSELKSKVGKGLVDVILCPVGPGAAPPLDCARYWGYTSQWNLLDYPALVFPVTKVDPEKDLKDEGYQPRNEKDRYNYQLYGNPESYRDAPISLQLVGRRYDDEKIIQVLDYMMKYVELPFSNM